MNNKQETGMPVRSLNRHSGIDAFRVLAFAAVVFLHAYQPVPQAPNIDVMLIYLTRWAVPFFFIASGYFLGLSNPETTTGILKLFKRLAPVLAVWLFVYVIYAHKLDSLRNPLTDLHYIISGGPGFHLWFLFSLGVSAAAVLLVRRFGWIVMLSVALAFFIAGLAFGPYRVFLHLPEIPYPAGSGFKTRWGPFLGFIMVSVGYYFGATGRAFSLKSGAMLILVGIGLQYLEAYAIWFHDGISTSFDYLAGTLPFGVGSFLVALNLRDSTALRRIAVFGPVTLGAYCIHLLFIQLLGSRFGQNEISSALLLSLVVFILSLAVSYALSRLPAIGKLVR